MIDVKTNGDMIIEEGSNGRSTDNQNLKLLKNGILKSVVTEDDEVLQSASQSGILPIPVGSSYINAKFILGDDGTGSWIIESDASDTVVLAKLTAEGADGFITFVNGIITDYQSAT